MVDPPPTDTTVVDPPQPPVDTIDSALPLSRYYEAECAEVGRRWVTQSDPLAGSGAYVVVEKGFESKETAPPDVPDNYVRFRVEVPKDSTYQILARINAPSRNADSYWYRLDGGEWQLWWRYLTTFGDWAWREVPDGPFAWAKGEHTLDIAYREKNTRLDRLYVGPAGALPEGVGDPDPDCTENSPEMAIFAPFGTAPAVEAAEPEWSLYPNPAKDHLTVLLPGPPEAYKQLTVSDVNGRMIRELRKEQLAGQPSLRIDLSALPAGLYRVRVVTDESDSSRTFVRVY